MDSPECSLEKPGMAVFTGSNDLMPESRCRAGSAVLHCVIRRQDKRP